jgi:hypothetical protein
MGSKTLKLSISSFCKQSTNELFIHCRERIELYLVNACITGTKLYIVFAQLQRIGDIEYRMYLLVSLLKLVVFFTIVIIKRLSIETYT